MFDKLFEAVTSTTKAVINVSLIPLEMISQGVEVVADAHIYLADEINELCDNLSDQD